MVGVDVFVESSLSSDALGKSIERVAADLPVRLKMVSNRGTKVYPATGAITDCVDHWRCRFMAREPSGELADADILDLLLRVAANHRWMHVEKLQEFDGVRGFTLAQGED